MERKPIPMLLHRDTIIMIIIRYLESDSQVIGLWITSSFNSKAFRYPTLSPAKKTCQTVDSMMPAVMDGR